MVKELRSGTESGKEPLEFAGRETKIEAIPDGYNYVEIDGYFPFVGKQGRALGHSLMTLAEMLGGYSPSGTDLPHRKEFEMSLFSSRSPEQNRELLKLLNESLAGGSTVKFSKVD